MEDGKLNLQTRGFLSHDITRWIEFNRKANAAWFQLADELNMIAQRRLLLLSVEDTDLQRFYMALLYCRGVSNFQATIVLAERGATLEARVLARTLFETVFYFGAIRLNPALQEKFAEDDRSHRRKIALALLRSPPELSSLDTGCVEILNNFMSELPETNDNAFNVADLANKAGLGAAYNTYYRGLSNDAAHPSLTALRRHIDETEKTFRWGPVSDDIVDTMLNICTAVIYLLSFAQEHFGWNNFSEEFEPCWSEYQRLIDNLRRSRQPGDGCETRRLWTAGDRPPVRLPWGALDEIRTGPPADDTRERCRCPSPAYRVVQGVPASGRAGPGRDGC